MRIRLYGLQFCSRSPWFWCSCVCARICRYGLRLCFHSPWFWCSCVCVQIRRYGLRLCFRSPWFWCSCVCERIRRYGQGLRSCSPWLVVVFIAVFGHGDVGKDCALALLGLVLVFIPVVAQRQCSTVGCACFSANSLPNYQEDEFISRESLENLGPSRSAERHVHIVLAIGSIREPEHSRQSRVSQSGDWPPFRGDDGHLSFTWYCCHPHPSTSSLSRTVCTPRRASSNTRSCGNRR